MKGKLSVYYDPDGDFLELTVGRPSAGHFKNLGDGIFERIDRKTGAVTGVAIMGFRKRTQSKKTVTVRLPLRVEVLSAKA